MTFDELINALGRTTGADSLSVDLPENWTQGRTAYGGITAALGLAAARAAIPDLPPLRSAQVAFVGPLSGTLEFRPSLLRSGRSASFVRVDGFAEDRLGTSITFVFASGRESAVERRAPVEPFTAGETFRVPAPVLFAQNFDYWLVESSPSLVDRVVRLQHESALDAEIELLAIGDLLPPPALFEFPQVVPLSTMSWQIDLAAPARRSPDRRWRVRSNIEMLEHGLSTQSMRLWDGEGRLQAMGRQLVALFG